MQATKFKVTVEVEVLSLDVAPALIAEAIDNISMRRMHESRTHHFEPPRVAAHAAAFT